MKNKYDNSETAVFYKPTSLGGIDLIVQETGYEKCDAGHAWGPDKKPAHCLHYCISGKGRIVVKEKTFNIHSGQLFYCSPEISAYYEADKNDPWEYIWVNFNGSITKSVFKTTTVSGENPVIDDLDGEFKTFFLKILESFEKRENHFLISTGYCYLMLDKIVSLHGKNINPNTYLQSIISQCVNLISQNLLGNISVDSLAKKVGLCRSQLFRIFISELGYSPKEYITRMKIIYAAELIKYGNVSIYKAAAEVGYNNYNSFSKSFKRIIGFLPTEFVSLSKEGKFIEEGTYKDFLKFLNSDN